MERSSYALVATGRACTQDIYLNQVPLPPLDWDIQAWCGGGYYPNK